MEEKRCEQKKFHIVTSRTIFFFVSSDLFGRRQQPCEYTLQEQYEKNWFANRVAADRVSKETFEKIKEKALVRTFDISSDREPGAY